MRGHRLQRIQRSQDLSPVSSHSRWIEQAQLQFLVRPDDKQRPDRSGGVQKATIGSIGLSRQHLKGA